MVVGHMPRLRFLSPDWFTVARRLAAPVRISPSTCVRVQFATSEARWHLVVHEGRVASFDLGSLGDAEVELRWGIDDAQRIWRAELRGNAALVATTVAAPTPDGPYVGLPAPSNLACRPELQALPVVPEATIGVQYVCRDGPFGEVRYALRFQDGQLVDERLGELDNPDVRVHIGYRALALVRCGEMTILEALEDGSVYGQLGPMATLAGIWESREFHRAELATGRHAVALASLGELVADPVFAARMQDLAARTGRL
jgi:hypothetical protein